VIRINLAPPRARHGIGTFSLQMPAFNLGMLFLVVYVVAGAGIGAYWWYLSSTEARLTAEVARARRELTTLQPVTAQIQRVKDQLGDLKKRVKVIEDLTRDQSRLIRIFDAFASVVPNDLWITKMEERDNVLKVSGTAFSPLAVSDLMTNLRSSGKFKDVDIVISRQDLAKTPRLVTFEVTCRVEI
jgi:type IV pilus assembly protein PilN